MFKNTRIGKKMSRKPLQGTRSYDLSIVTTQGVCIHHTVDEICLGSTLMMMFLLLLTWLVLSGMLNNGGKREVRSVGIVSTSISNLWV